METTESHPRPSFEASPDTRLLTQALLDTKPGGTCDFAALSEAVGRAVVGGDSNLQSALRIALNANGVVFASVRGVGYKRLLPSEILRQSEHDIKRVGRAAKRGATKLITADSRKLEPGDRNMMFARLSSLSLIAHATRPKTIEKLQTVAANKGQELALAQTMAALSDR